MICPAIRLLDRSQAGCQQTQPKNPACTATTRQESSKEIGCLKAESRQAFSTDICNHLCVVQLSSYEPAENWTILRNAVHSLAVDILGHASRKHQDWFDENDEEIQGFWKKNTACSRHIKMLLAQCPRRQPTTIFVRRSRADSVTCKIPG